IRRDLNALARQGKLVKIHGGATSLEEEEFLARAPGRNTAHWP
ncbi:MAG: DeoR family transcriptional regulator, partial [Lawsonibacter sp.]|nr:DeoR family transcriptional regulator [Lawsonibacter sp.]